MNTSDYILVTAARDEEKIIRHTLESVVTQTFPPKHWVIVSDGSSDGTDEIVRGFANRHSFIRLVRREAGSQRNFGSKVQAIRFGLEHMPPCAYNFIGILDGDLSFEETYFDQVLRMFALDAKLGIAGGIYHEKAGDHWHPLRTALEWSVPGGVQMFRRECYEAIGGYVELPKGGVDIVAEVMARQKGWKVRTNSDLAVRHHRSVGTATGGVLGVGFTEGWRSFTVGYDPAYMLAKCASRLAERPYLIGSLCQIAGYGVAWLRTGRPVVPESSARFLRQEQRDRLLSCLKGRVSRKSWG